MPITLHKLHQCLCLIKDLEKEQLQKYFITRLLNDHPTISEIEGLLSTLYTKTTCLKPQAEQ